MKRLLVLLSLIALLAVSCCTNVSAQTPDPESYMTPTQLAEYNSDKAVATIQKESDKKIAELEKKLESYGKVAGVGAEVGIAMKEGLTAVVDVADKFSGTDVGKFTMVLVAWKVVGKDVTRIVLGLLFFIIMVVGLTWTYKKQFIDRRVLVSKEPQGFWKGAIRKYEIIESKFDEEDKSWSTIIFIAVALISVLITKSIMF